jgi:hypothetical protein
MEALLTKLFDQLLSSGPYGVLLLVLGFVAWRVAKWLAPDIKAIGAAHLAFLSTTSVAIDKLTENQTLQLQSLQLNAETNEKMQGLVERIGVVDEQKFVLLRDIAKTQGVHGLQLESHGQKLDEHGRKIDNLTARIVARRAAAPAPPVPPQTT